MKGNNIADKNHLLLMILMRPIIQQIMLLILEMIMRLGKIVLVFKNNAQFINCISKINGLQIDNAEDLDVVMSMYNLL